MIKETKNYYSGGLLHGYEKSFFETGEIRREVDYTNGYNNKIIKTFKKNGEISIK
jgi:antitoxin component YwqK of YwqJK toxin-antitoxin module